MKIFVITINYNDAEGLSKTVSSVASQHAFHDYDVCHIIVDGASTDGSVDVINNYESTIAEQSLPIKLLWVSEKDNGIYNAMNKGLEIALGRRDAMHGTPATTGTDENPRVVVGENEARPNCKMQKLQSVNEDDASYIQILNAGDILAAPDVIERMLAQLSIINNQSSIPVDILYGNMLKAMPDGKIVRDNCGGASAPESFLYFYTGTLNHDCAYIRRSLFADDQVGLYDEQMKICSDWKWYVDAIALRGIKPVYVDIDVTVFDMNGVSESGGKNKAIILKERRDYLEQVLPASVLRDYDAYSFPISQYNRLKKHHLWGLVWFMERVLFKLEKWHILR